MTAHSRIHAWRIPWAVEPGRLQSIGLQRVRHDWSGLAFRSMHSISEWARWYFNSSVQLSRSVVSNFLWPHGLQQVRLPCPSNSHGITYQFSLKSRDIILSTKVCLVKAMVFPVVIYGCESWTIKKAEGRSIDGFELWCLRRLLRVPWTTRRSNQSILKETSPEYSLEGLMLKLKLQFFGLLVQRTDFASLYCFSIPIL